MVESTIGLMLDDFFSSTLWVIQPQQKKRCVIVFPSHLLRPVDDAVHVSRVTTVPLFLYIYRRPISIYFTSPFMYLEGFSFYAFESVRGL